MLEPIITFIVEIVSQFGYFGIFAMMFLESTFFPFPSEIVMIPAGYLAYKGEMNLYIAIACGIAGSLGGALFNYYLARLLGRRFLLHFGKDMFISEQTLQKVESFFTKHGHISTFSGRLIPAIRQFISLPAGLARMNIWEFSAYTTLGAGIWVVTLTLLGYFIGHNEELLKDYLDKITIGIIVALIVLAVGYVSWNKRKNRLNSDL